MSCVHSARVSSDSADRGLTTTDGFGDLVIGQLAKYGSVHVGRERVTEPSICCCVLSILFVASNSSQALSSVSESSVTPQLVVAGALRLKQSPTTSCSRWAATFSRKAVVTAITSPTTSRSTTLYLYRHRLNRQRWHRCLRISDQETRVSRWGTTLGRSTRRSTCPWVRLPWHTTSRSDPR